jgi:dsRNA-specific ribonuclease
LAKGSGKTKQVAKRISAEEALKILYQKEIVIQEKKKVVRI